MGIEIEIFQKGNQFTGLENILSRSPQLQSLTLSNQGASVRNQSITGINLSRCEMPCITTFHLESVILEANTFMNLVSNAPLLQNLFLYYCTLKGEQVIECQLPNLLTFYVYKGKSGVPVNLVAPKLQQLDIEEKSTFILPHLKNDTLRKVVLHNGCWRTTEYPAFESYFDTLLTNHSESLKELKITHNGWLDNKNYQFTALRKLVFDGGSNTTNEMVNIFKMCPNLLEIEIFSIDDANENGKLNIVEEETYIVPKLMNLSCELYNGHFSFKVFSGLRELALRNDKYGSFMKGLSSTYLPYLRKLTISGYDIGNITETFDIGRAARNFPDLEYLDAYYCKIEISDDGQQIFFPCLQKLELDQVKIDDDNIKILAAKLPANIDLSKSLTFIDPAYFN